MAVQDLWIGRDGQPTARHGRGKRYRVSVPGHPTRSFDARRPAQRWEGRLLAEPAWAQDTATTVGELLEAWLSTKAHLSARGREAVVTAAGGVRGRWGEVLACDVTREAAQAWISAEPGSPSRLHKLAQALGGALALGVERGIIQANVAQGLRVPREAPRDPVYLTGGQVRRLARAAHAPLGRGSPRRMSGWYAPLVWLLATTGVRPSEALALDVGDVVRRRVGGRRVWRGRIRRSKTGRARDVPIPAKVVAMLDLDRPSSVPLIVTPAGRRVRLKAWREYVWRPAVAAAGLDAGMVPYELRHTAASWAIADGADVKAVQRMLGHSSAKMTLDVYGHLWDEGLDDVARRMDRRVS